VTAGRPRRVECWSIAEYGEPRDVLRRGARTLPELESHEVQVEVEAIGLNFLDVSMCRGEYVSTPSLPLVPGAELAGRIVGAGSAASQLSVGDRVAALSPAAQGAYATAAVVPAAAAYPIPEAMPAADAAAILVTYQTAYFALVHRAALNAGEWLLVHAGAGGVGTAAIQLARARGARIVATAGSGDKVVVCLQEGADVAVDYRRDDFVAAALDATGGRGVDVVLDPVGGDVFARSLACSGIDARVIPIGWASGRPPELRPEEIVARNITVVGVSWGSTYPLRRAALVRSAHEVLLAAYDAREIRPHVARRWEFDELPAAVQALADGEIVGKAVVRAPARASR
jgi:NADPH2:quinone reductase